MVEAVLDLAAKLSISVVAKRMNTVPKRPELTGEVAISTRNIYRVRQWQIPSSRS